MTRTGTVARLALHVNQVNLGTQAAEAGKSAGLAVAGDVAADAGQIELLVVPDQGLVGAGVDRGLPLGHGFVVTVGAGRAVDGLVALGREVVGGGEDVPQVRRPVRRRRRGRYGVLGSGNPRVP